jgi:hypothetical protein
MKRVTELERVYDRHVGQVGMGAVAIGGYLSSWCWLAYRFPVYFKESLLSLNKHPSVRRCMCVYDLFCSPSTIRIYSIISTPVPSTKV